VIGHGGLNPASPCVGLSTSYAHSHKLWYDIKGNEAKTLLIASGDQGYRSMLQVKQFVDLGCNSPGGQGGPSADVTVIANRCVWT